ncbi:gamma carbonic anhydrase family protein [Streptomyces sp. NPDC127098]|uniref:gamma carbonic anhydrase family protein n=1 Tax=Streptomyces sp. NPDC127098 TaxID=3347137 RepID=UPI0036557867
MTYPPDPRGPRLIALEGRTPVLAPGAWVAPGATVVGDVHLAEESSVWYGTVVRADTERIEIGPGSNLQDGTVVHADPGFPAILGAGVSVGHRAVVHGAVVEDDVLVGMGSVLLNGVRVGRGSLIAAGAVLLEGTEIPPGSLVAGVPGKVRRQLTEEDVARIRANADHYRAYARRHAKEATPLA